MECKVPDRTNPLRLTREIIETYWNVKAVPRFLITYSVSEIIETYWNVKAHAPDVPSSGILEIIETYWNVKTDTAKKKMA